MICSEILEDWMIMKVYYEKTVSDEALVASRLVMCQDGGYRNFPNLKVVTQTSQPYDPCK